MSAACVAVAVFLLIGLPMLSGRNHSAAVEVDWPLPKHETRAFDVCACSGHVYLGTRVPGPGIGGDLFNAPRHPPPSQPVKFFAGCGDGEWTIGADYQAAFQEAGHALAGIGFVRYQNPQSINLHAATAITMPVWLAATLPLLISAVMQTYYLRRRYRRLIGRCPVCGYDLRATPNRCPECGHVGTKPMKATA